MLSRELALERLIMLPASLLPRRMYFSFAFRNAVVLSISSMRLLRAYSLSRSGLEEACVGAL